MVIIIIWANIISLSSFIIILRHFTLQKERVNLKKNLPVILGVTIPFCASLIDHLIFPKLGLYDLPDISGFSTAISLMFWINAIFNQDILNLLPAMKLKHFIHSISNPFLIFKNHSFKIILANDTAQKLLCLSTSDINHKSFFQLHKLITHQIQK